MSQRVEFYLLESESEGQRMVCACKIAAKAYKQGLRVFLRVEDKDRVAQLDQLLWHFNPASFIPHCAAVNLAEQPRTPVVIGDQQAPDGFDQLLISLSRQVPADIDRFDRVADLISNEETNKQHGRQRFKHYRQLGIEPTTHQIAG